MRKHFLLLFLMALLPLAGFAEGEQLVAEEPTLDLTAGATLSKVYDGTEPTITVKANDEVLTGTWETNGGVLAGTGENAKPTAAAGTYIWTESNPAEGSSARTATYVIRKKEIVYYLTGRTYAVGDAPDITNHYSKASGEFIGEDKLENFATFDFATSGNDALDLDENKRFTKIKTYNITALRVIEKPVHQNYDFRFTSTAVIVVTAKSIAGFLADPVADQAYTGSQITFDANALPKIYANEADKTAGIALDPSNYDFDFGENTNVAYTTGATPAVTNGGTIIYKGKGNYEGELVIPFKIQPLELKSVTVGEIEEQTFAHKNIEPELVVKGKDDQDKEFTLTKVDYEVSYLDNDEKPTNFNAGTATGKLTIKGGNFKTATGASVQNAGFEIKPKSLADEKIKLTGSIKKTYTGAALTQNTTGSGDNPIAVKWTIAENNVVDLTSILTYTYLNNIGVGKATIKAEPKTDTDSEGSFEEGAGQTPDVSGDSENQEDPANYTGFTSATFDILPTDLVTANVTISLKKRNTQVANEEADNAWIDATYQYEGRKIEPGKKGDDGKYADGKVVVKNGATELVEGKDYEIVSYGDDMENIKGDNTNASVTPDDDESVVKTRGTVTIQGLGNYGAINELAEPIKMSKDFEIAKRKVVLTAKAITTTFGVSPEDKFAYESNVVDKDKEGNVLTAEKLLGGKVTYKVQKKANDDTDFSVYEGELTALQVTQEGNTIYQYYPVMMSLPETAQGGAEAEAPVPGVDYVSEDQKAARANYEFPVFGEGGEGVVVVETGVIGAPATITVTAAKWTIVVDNKEKKYGVADKALGFTYTVYNGDEKTGEKVEDPRFDENAAPYLGRTPDNNGEDVNDNGYTISVLNAEEDVTVGTDDAAVTHKKVAKTGYTIVIKTGTLTINPFPITVTANDQTIIYGSKANLETKEDSKVKTVTDGVETDGTQLTVTFTPVMLGNKNLITRELLNLTLKVEDGYDGTVGDTHVLIPRINNKNFEPTYINGKLTVVAGSNIDVVRLDANEYAAATTISNSNTIKNFDGETAGFTLKATSTIDAFKTIYANRWYALVLPFNTSVREVSKAFGYAVVDKFNTESSNTKDVSFKLHVGPITANEPFIFKVDKDIDLSTDPVTFTGVEIDYAEEPSVSAADGKVKFIGVYDGKQGFKGHEYIFSLGSGNISGTNEASYIPPMSAYIHMDDQMNGMNNAPVFNIEEPDGSTTSISAVDFATNGSVMSNEGWYTVNGIKLTAAPTEKGVYVNNGKKVVIK
jgi:hypothetical protein